MKVLRAVTGYNERLLCAVDYVSGTLINDHIKLLTRIATDFTVAVNLEQETLHLHLNLVKNILKGQYDGHACKEGENCDTHSVEFSLGLGEAGDQRDAGQRKSTCSDCKFVPFVIDEILKAIENKESVEEDEHADAKRVIGYCLEKLELYQGHRLRVAHQQKVLKQLTKAMEDRCIENKAVTRPWW